ncbi:MAG: hypothetical protein II629_09680 [Ruminococcus sp.]|nr:hypothetical protein [Ruminococcus sp.]
MSIRQPTVAAAATAQKTRRAKGAQDREAPASKRIFLRHTALKMLEIHTSISALFALSGTKISLFEVLRSFERGIFRSGERKTTGNPLWISGGFRNAWAEKGRSKPDESLSCAP